MIARHVRFLPEWTERSLRDTVVSYPVMMARIPSRPIRIPQQPTRPSRPDHLSQTPGHRMPVRRSEDKGLQPGRHPSLDRQKVELVGRSRCPGHGMGCKGGIYRARNTETASKVSWAIRKIHLPHWSRRNQKALANPPGTSLPTLAQNQAENRMSRLQGARSTIY